MGTKGIFKGQIISQSVLGAGVSVIIVVWGLIFRNIYINNPEYIRNNIVKTLPEGAFLRDYKKLDEVANNAYLVIYIDKGYMEQKAEPETLLSCPGEIVGQSIMGKYHLELLQNYKVVNEVPLPNYSQEDLELVHINIKGNIYSDLNRPDKFDTEVVPLLVLKDYTGDGKAYEFLLKTTLGGCGFWDGLVAGYDPETNKAVLYSDWIHNLNPDKKGYFHYIFDCGNHGNETKVEEDYQFSPAVRKFIKTGEKQTSCNA